VDASTAAPSPLRWRDGGQANGTAMAAASPAQNDQDAMGLHLDALGLDTGDLVLLSRPCARMGAYGGVICTCAKWAHWTEWDHIGVVVRGEDGELLLVDAQFNGVRAYPLKDRLRRTSAYMIAVRRLHCLLTDEMRQGAVELVREIRDKPYKDAGLQLLRASVRIHPAKLRRRRLHGARIREEQLIAKLEEDLLSMADKPPKDALMVNVMEVELAEARRRRKQLLELQDTSHPSAFENRADPSSLFCSELVALLYQRMGLLDAIYPSSNDYLPCDFASRPENTRGRVELRKGAWLEEEVWLKGRIPKGVAAPPPSTSSLPPPPKGWERKALRSGERMSGRERHLVIEDGSMDAVVNLSHPTRVELKTGDSLGLASQQWAAVAGKSGAVVRHASRSVLGRRAASSPSLRRSELDALQRNRLGALFDRFAQDGFMSEQQFYLATNQPVVEGRMPLGKPYMYVPKAAETIWMALDSERSGRITREPFVRLVSLLLGPAEPGQAAAAVSLGIAGARSSSGSSPSPAVYQKLLDAAGVKQGEPQSCSDLPRAMASIGGSSALASCLVKGGGRLCPPALRDYLAHLAADVEAFRAEWGERAPPWTPDQSEYGSGTASPLSVAFAGALALTFTAPLDRAQVWMQTSGGSFGKPTVREAVSYMVKIAKGKEGRFGVWRANGFHVAWCAPALALQATFYPAFLQQAEARGLPLEVAHALAGGLPAALLAGLATPVEVVRARFMMSPPTATVASVVKSVWEGRDLLRGCGLTAAWAFVGCGVYSAMAASFASIPEVELDIAPAGGAGGTPSLTPSEAAVAGLAGALSAHPLDTLRRRAQVLPLHPGESWRSALGSSFRGASLMTITGPLRCAVAATCMALCSR
jgi:hypothetical protein